MLLIPADLADDFHLATEVMCDVGAYITDNDLNDTLEAKLMFSVLSLLKEIQEVDD